MTRLPLKERLRQGLFFLDGAMGTQLIEAGAKPGLCSELLNIEAPQIVASVHRAYIDAGCDAVLTNSFGANAVSLKRHSLSERAFELNKAAASLARQSAGDKKHVLGDIGPCGDFLQPLGALTEEKLLAAFTKQAQGLLAGGVDGFIIETMTALEEVEIAVKAVQGVCDLPVLVCLAYDPAGAQARTMMGIGPSQAVERLVPLGIAAVGFNCGTLDMPGYVALAKEYASALKGAACLLIAEPNAGRPHLEGSKTVYSLGPKDFADALVKIHSAGATILGGCCGTTPAHIAAAVAAIKG
jgi:5-methyltetrahydrofolate--homocysteine methyltransferase